MSNQVCIAVQRRNANGRELSAHAHEVALADLDAVVA